MTKFRAFIKANTETVYGGLGYADDCVLPVGLIDFTDREVTVWGCGRENCGLCGDDFRLDDIILMQSTGLLDLNGNEIFADDIVKMPWRVYDESELFVVKTKSGHVARVDNGHKGTELWLRHHHCEVVGNIWENPDMMEGFE